MDINSVYNKIVSTKFKYYSSYNNKMFEMDLINDKEEAKAALREVITDIFADYQVEIATLKAKVYAYETVIANSNFKPILYQSVEDITKPLLSQEQQEEI